MSSSSDITGEKEKEEGNNSVKEEELVSDDDSYEIAEAMLELGKARKGKSISSDNNSVGVDALAFLEALTRLGILIDNISLNDEKDLVEELQVGNNEQQQGKDNISLNPEKDLVEELQVANNEQQQGGDDDDDDDVAAGEAVDDDVAAGETDDDDVAARKAVVVEVSSSNDPPKPLDSSLSEELSLKEASKDSTD